MANKRENETEKVSKEAQVEALRIAKGTQRPKQTKEQTKVIAQGVEKGIAEYRKLEKAKARERDKQKKKENRSRADQADIEVPADTGLDFSKMIPWFLLVLSWGAFLGFYFLA